MKFAQGVGKLFRNHAQENKFTPKNFGENNLYLSIRFSIFFANDIIPFKFIFFCEKYFSEKLAKKLQLFT